MLNVYLSGPWNDAAVEDLAEVGALVVGPFVGGHGEDLRALRAADVVVLLPGWETSADARLDLMIARAAGVDFAPLADVLAA